MPHRPRHLKTLLVTLILALTVGLILIDQNDGVAYLGIHIGLVSAAFFLAQYNRFVVLKKW